MKSYCQAPTGVNCVKPASILRFFDGSFKTYSRYFDQAYGNIPQTLNEALVHTKTSKLLSFTLGSGSVVNSAKASSSVIRSFVNAGSPLDGFNGTDDRRAIQRDKLRTFHRNVFIPFLEDISLKGLKGGKIKFYFYSESILDVYIIDRTLKDLPLLLSSVLLIFLLVYVRVGSFFISAFGVLSTINCFFFAHIIYVVMVQATYLAVYHLLSAFILLGLGSYNIFIIYDIWIETETLPIKGHVALPYRYADCISHGGRVLASLTLTTGFCFAMQMFSPFRIIGLFGLFAAILMFVNFAMTVIFLPVTFLVHETRMSKFKYDCCVKKTELDLDRERRKGPVELFLSTSFFALLTGKVSRLIIIFGFLAMSLGVCALFFAIRVVFEDVS